MGLPLVARLARGQRINSRLIILPLGVNGIAETSLNRIALATLIALLITLLHELCHTATGLVLGMKLRAFIVGPFQWRIHDGKWSFQFRPAEILFAGGATGVVPGSMDFPRWRSLCMMTAGPLMSLISGVFALWIGFAERGNSRLQADGLPVLFGAWSLAGCAINLVPIRTKDFRWCDDLSRPLGGFPPDHGGSWLYRGDSPATARLRH